MKGALHKQVFNHGGVHAHHSFNTNSEQLRPRRNIRAIPFLALKSAAIIDGSTSSLLKYDGLMPEMQRHNHQISATRRRRAYQQSDGTYVLLEPGKNEEFVTEEELKDRLKYWLENWPGGNAGGLPPDLAKFKTIDEAVSHLVKSVCELEVDGEVGSIQWYQVRLEDNM